MIFISLRGCKGSISPVGWSKMKFAQHGWQDIEKVRTKNSSLTLDHFLSLLQFYAKLRFTVPIGFTSSKVANLSKKTCQVFGSNKTAPGSIKGLLPKTMNFNQIFLYQKKVRPALVSQETIRHMTMPVLPSFFLSLCGTSDTFTRNLLQLLNQK